MVSARDNCDVGGGVFAVYMRKRISIIKIYVPYYVSYLLCAIRNLCQCERFFKVTLFMGVGRDGCPESVFVWNLQ
jgi:hypothetical protein